MYRISAADDWIWSTPFPARGGSRILERRVQALEDFEISQRSRRGDAEGIAGAECERGDSLSLGGGLGLPQKLFKSWVFSPVI